MECLICTEPIRHAHLGVNSCRACAVFYKRTADAKKELKCKGGAGDCRENNPKTTCRLCRYTRFNEILKKAATPAGLTKPEAAPQDDISSFIHHESFYECEPSTSQTPLLDRLKKGYSLMCLIRYSGEMANRPITDEQEEIRVGKMVLVPCTYSTFLQHGKLCKEATKAFATHSFDDFRDLDDESKEFIMTSSYRLMNSMDSAYRAAHHFPTDDDMRTPGYTTYIRLANLEQFFEACTDDNVDTEKVIEEFRKGTQRSGLVVRRYFRKVQPTDYEFLALLGLSLWNDEIANVNEKMLKIAMKNRAAIMSDLHAYYAQQGRLDYAARIGDLFCVLVNFQVNAMRIHEDFHLFRLMNVFNDYFDKNPP